MNSTLKRLSIAALLSVAGLWGLWAAQVHYDWDLPTDPTGVADASVSLGGMVGGFLTLAVSVLAGATGSRIVTFLAEARRIKAFRRAVLIPIGLWFSLSLISLVVLMRGGTWEAYDMRLYLGACLLLTINGCVYTGRALYLMFDVIDDVATEQAQERRKAEIRSRSPRANRQSVIGTSQKAS